MNGDLIKYASLKEELSPTHYLAAYFDFFRGPQNPVATEPNGRSAIGAALSNGVVEVLRYASIEQLVPVIERGAAWAGVSDPSEIKGLLQTIRAKQHPLVKQFDPDWPKIKEKLLRLESMDLKATHETCPVKNTGNVSIEMLEQFLASDSTVEVPLNGIIPGLDL